MALVIQNLQNCVDQYFKPENRSNKLYRTLALGYIEACLIQFDVIESKDNGIVDYAIKKWDGTAESRAEIIIRLAQQFLKKEEKI